MKIQLPIALGLLLVAGLATSACTEQESASNEAAIIGAYTLISVDGTPVPATINHQGAAMQVISGRFAINADGTCSSMTVFVPPTGTEITRNVNATYARKGSTLHMQWQGAGKTVGTVEGDVFTMDNEGMVFVYRK